MDGSPLRRRAHESFGDRGGSMREIGVAAWLDGHDPSSSQRVSVGTARPEWIGLQQPTALPRAAVCDSLHETVICR